MFNQAFSCVGRLRITLMLRPSGRARVLVEPGGGGDGENKSVIAFPLSFLVAIVIDGGALTFMSGFVVFAAFFSSFLEAVEALPLPLATD